MPTITTTVECPIHESFRVQQVAGMFDLPPREKCDETFSVELPALDEDWTLGAIVGPSGSGKSTIARIAYGQSLYRGSDWPHDRAVIDGFGDLPIKQITQTLTAIGFSSPPSWLKPYHVLSNGERFRCDLARALLKERRRQGEGEPGSKKDKKETFPASPHRSSLPISSLPLVVFDEFTSVVDRTVAKVGSAAIAKSIRNGRIGRRFVAVTCHYDVLEWLEPDWVVDMASCKLTRGRLRRPQLALEVVRCSQQAWRIFARHHYLDNNLTPVSKCYLALWQGEPVAFCAVVALYGFKGRKRIGRIVTLPDYQGLGIGPRLMECCAENERQLGFRVNITSSHPAMIGYCKRSPRWRAVNIRKAGNASRQFFAGREIKSALNRAVVSFEFLGA